MIEFSEKLNKLKQAVHLDSSRKQSIRAHLTAYMDQHPVAPAPVKPSILERLSGVVKMFSLVSLKPFPLVALIVVIFLVATAGTAAAAEKALPGQLLYTWKTGINEKIQLQLIRDEDQKAEFEMTLAARRLAEASALADQGKLSASAQAQIRTSFEQYSNHAQIRVAQLEQDNNHGKADKLKEKLAAVIESHQQQLSDIGASADVNIDNKLNVTDNAILSSQAVINLDISRGKDDQKQSVNTRRQADLKKAQGLLLQARANLKSGNKNEAIRLNQEASALNQQIIQFRQDNHLEKDGDKSDSTESNKDSTDSNDSGSKNGSDGGRSIIPPLPKVEIKSQ